METVLVWNNARSFQRHVADMNLFRCQHQNSPGQPPDIFRDMPRPGDIQLPGNFGGAKFRISPRRQSMLVPIWEIELPGGIQN